MLGLFKPKPKSTEEQIKKQRDEWLQQMLEASQKLGHLIHSDKSGWKEFCELIEDYMDKVKKRKAITALDVATDADIYQLKLLDHELFILSWIMKAPQQFINQTEAKIKKENDDG